jgi:hypothetical protein
MVQPPLYDKTGYNQFKPVFPWSYNIYQIQKTATKTAKDRSTYTAWVWSFFWSYGLDLETLRPTIVDVLELSVSNFVPILGKVTATFCDMS